MSQSRNRQWPIFFRKVPYDESTIVNEENVLVGKLKLSATTVYTSLSSKQESEVVQVDQVREFRFRD